MGALHDISAKSSSPSKFCAGSTTKLISYAGNVLLTILKGKLELYREREMPKKIRQVCSKVERYEITLNFHLLFASNQYLLQSITNAK